MRASGWKMNTNGRKTPRGDKNLTRRSFCLAVLLAASCLLFRTPLNNLAVFATTHDYGSHIFFLVPISLYLIYLRRDQVFSEVQSHVLPSSILFLTAGALKSVANAFCARGGSDCLW